MPLGDADDFACNSKPQIIALVSVGMSVLQPRIAINLFLAHLYFCHSFARVFAFSPFTFTTSFELPYLMLIFNSFRSNFCELYFVLLRVFQEFLISIETPRSLRALNMRLFSFFIFPGLFSPM